MCALRAASDLSKSVDVHAQRLILAELPTHWQHRPRKEITPLLVKVNRFRPRVSRQNPD